MKKIRQPDLARQRADHIGDMIAPACEKLVELATEWFELNDQDGLEQAREMLDANEVTLLLSVHLEASGLGHIALNLLRTDTPMPRPFFEVRTPMLRWTVNSMNQKINSPRGAVAGFAMREQWRSGGA